MFSRHTIHGRSRASGGSEEGPRHVDQDESVRLLSVWDDLGAAVERAKAFEVRAIHECLRRLDHYDRLLQADRGQPVDAAPVESVGRAAHRSTELARLPELPGSSLLLSSATSHWRPSVEAEPPEIVAISRPRLEPVVSATTTTPGAKDEAGGVSRRIRGEMRSTETRQVMCRPEEWDWKTQELFRKTGDGRKRRLMTLFGRLFPGRRGSGAGNRVEDHGPRP
jgi:hypothetical protein